MVCRFKDTEVGFKLTVSYSSSSSTYSLSVYTGFFNSQNQFVSANVVSFYYSLIVNNIFNVFYSNIDDAIISFSFNVATTDTAVNIIYQRCSIENHNYVLAYISGSSNTYWSDRGRITGFQYIYSVSDELSASKQANTNYYGGTNTGSNLQYASSVKNSCYFRAINNYMTISQSSFLDIVSGKINYINNSNKKLYILGDENNADKEVQVGTTYLVNGTPMIATSRYLYAFF